MTSVAALGMYYRARQRKVPISQPRLVIVTSLAYFVGAVFGQARRAAAHINFVRGLEDRDRFMQALQNIYQRETGEIPAVGPARTVDIHGDSKQPVDTPWTPESAAASPNNLPAVPPTPNQGTRATYLRVRAYSHNHSSTTAAVECRCTKPVGRNPRRKRPRRADIVVGRITPAARARQRT